jgi:hypothetical protein
MKFRDYAALRGRGNTFICIKFQWRKFMSNSRFFFCRFRLNTDPEHQLSVTSFAASLSTHTDQCYCLLAAPRYIQHIHVLRLIYERLLNIQASSSTALFKQHTKLHSSKKIAHKSVYSNINHKII